MSFFRLILIKAYRFKFVFSFKTFNLHENDVVWYIHSANPNPSWDTNCFPSLYFTCCQHKNISAWLPQFCDLSSRFLLCELQKNKQTKGITEDWLSELKWTPPPFFCAWITLNLSEVSSPNAGRNDLWNDLRKKNWNKHFWVMTSVEGF